MDLSIKFKTVVGLESDAQFPEESS